MDSIQNKLTQLFYQILFRVPDRRELKLFYQSLKQGRITGSEIKERICQSWESRKLVHPAVAAVKKSYSRYLLRSPNAKDISKHLRDFRIACGDNHRATRILHEGKAENYLNIRPLFVEMDIINRCNLKCTMCHFSLSSFSDKKRELTSFDEFRRMGEQIFPGTYKLSLSLSTEALMHPDFLLMAEEALRNRIPKTFISTNGTLLKKETSEKLVEMGFHLINISMDAATKETYERLRRGRA
ncbi:MAG: radical SAM protein [Planctomycetes bacterium]|nr:radical SAM protein [Planctomycetota bacterium]